MAAVRTIVVDLDDPGQALLDPAETDRSDSLVTVACGHSRAREPIFGGVLRALPSEAPLPLLMAH